MAAGSLWKYIGHLSRDPRNVFTTVELTGVCSVLDLAGGGEGVLGVEVWWRVGAIIKVRWKK